MDTYHHILFIIKKIGIYLQYVILLLIINMDYFRGGKRVCLDSLQSVNLAAKIQNQIRFISKADKQTIYQLL